LLEDVPHRQVVFTIPKRLRIFFRYDRRLLGELAGCAWRALKLYSRIYFDRDDIVAGAIGFIATAGEILNFHPHIHVLITFITKPKTIKKVLDAMHVLSQKPEPLAHSPPLFRDTTVRKCDRRG